MSILTGISRGFKSVDGKREEQVERGKGCPRF